MKFHSFMISAAAIFPGLVCAANDSSRPFDQARDEYFTALVNRDFQLLEKEASASRERSLKLEDGQPRLAAFYAGVSGCLTSGCANNITPEEWETRLARLKEWNSAETTSTTAKIALATYYLEYGWSIRGQGHRDSVDANAWPVFQMNVEKARQELQSIASQGKTDPGWYASLLRVARAQGWSPQAHNNLYAESVKSFPDYLPLYFEKASYLAPRWYGTVDGFRAYVTEATKETYPALGKTLYARLNWLMSTNDMFHNGQADWREMKSGFERIVKDHPHAWNINNFAKFACMARDSETFMQMDKKIDGKPNLSAFSDDPEWYAWCKKYMVTRKEIKLITPTDARKK